MVSYHFYTISDTFDFGRYYGFTLSEVLAINPQYVYWCVYTIMDFWISDEALADMSVLYPHFIQSVDFMEMLQYVPQHYYDREYEDGYDDYDEEPTYDRYGGSYAQDELGYSDDDIDTVFDGDPSAYWNID